MSDTALFLIDLQWDFLDPIGRNPVPRAQAGRVIAAANRLLEHAEAAGWMRIFIKNEFRTSDRIGNFFRRGAAIEGTSGAGIDPRVAFPRDATVITKSRADAFSNRMLGEALRRAEIRQVIAVGVMTEGCVRATVQGALRRGYRVTVASDGVASGFGWLGQLGLRSMRKAGAVCRPCAEILGSASEPDLGQAGRHGPIGSGML